VKVDGIAGEVAASDEAERRTALRALLLHPLLLADSPHAGALLLVRRHREHLQRLCAEGLGYRLIVEARGARLVKAGLGRDATRGLRKRNDRPFEPRAYALLSLVLAALTRGPAQLMLDELVAQVRSAAADAELGVDLETASDRRALVAALQALVGFGVLVEREGQLASYGDDASAESLLDVRRDRLRLVLAPTMSGTGGPADLLDAAALPSAAGGARVALRRRLAESPVLSTDELTEDQAEWWRRNRVRERDWFADHLGLELELRAEGAVAIDPDEMLTDRPFPGTGSARQAALLVLEHLVGQVREQARGSGRSWWTLPADALSVAVRQVAGEHGRGFKRDYVDLDLLQSDVTAVLTDAGLLRTSGEQQVHAAAARYAPATTWATAQALF